MKPDIWLVRHGQTEWSESGRHTSRTDVPLTDAGRAAAQGLRSRLATHDFALVLVSPATRARTTAELAGYRAAEVEPALAERDYGELEGLTTAELHARGGAWATWTAWTGAMPGGESLDAAGERAAHVLVRADAAPGDVLLFGHGHELRILTAVALDLDPVVAARFVLDAASISVIGSEHEVRAIRAWNRT